MLLAYKTEIYVPCGTVDENPYFRQCGTYFINVLVKNEKEIINKINHKSLGSPIQVFSWTKIADVDVFPVLTDFCESSYSLYGTCYYGPNDLTSQTWLNVLALDRLHVYNQLRKRFTDGYSTISHEICQVDLY